MDGASDAEERAARNQLKSYLYAIVIAAGFGYILLTSTSIYWLFPFLAVARLAHYWWSEPAPDDGERGAEESGRCPECGDVLLPERERCDACGDVGRWRK